MTNRSDLDPKTIIYSGYGLPAHSYWIEVKGFGKDVKARRMSTTRDGQLVDYGPDLSSWTQADGLLFQFPNALSQLGSSGELLQRLVALWERPPSGVVPLHQRFRYGQGPQSRTHPCGIPRLALGVPYRIRMDWAFPYCLVSKEGQGDNYMGLYGDPSKVHGQVVKADPKWFPWVTVRFKKADDFHLTMEYVTEVLDAKGNVKQTLRPPALKGRVAKYFKNTPRLKLPHSRGYILLHKFWLRLLDAYHQHLRYGQAMSYLLGHGQLLGHIDHLLELSSRSVQADDCRRQCKGAADLLSVPMGKVEEARKAVDAVYRRRASALNYLISFWDKPAFKTLYKDHWSRFSHYPGPSNLQYLAMWLIRQSPLHASFFKRYGRSLIKFPKGDLGIKHAFSGPNLIDARLEEGNKHDPDYALKVLGGPKVKGTLDLLNKAIGLRAKVIGLYAYHIAAPFYPAFRHLESPKTLFPFPEKADMEAMFTYLTGDPAAGKKLAAQRTLLGHKGIDDDQLKKLSKVAGWKDKLAGVSSALSAFDLLFSLMELGKELSDPKKAWDPERVAKVIKDSLGLADAAASLAGATEEQVFKQMLGRFVAAVGVGYSSGQMIKSLFEGKLADAGLNAVKTAGAALVLASTYASAVPVAGLPMAAVLALAGALLTLGAGLVEWYDKVSADEWEKRALGLLGAIISAQRVPKYQSGRVVLVTSKGTKLNTNTKVWLGSFGGPVLKYDAWRRKWAKQPQITRLKKDSTESWSLVELLSDNDTWDGFTDGDYAAKDRWNALELPKAKAKKHKAAYEAYCKKLAAKHGKTWKPGQPPPPLPFSRPK